MVMRNFGALRSPSSEPPQARPQYLRGFFYINFLPHPTTHFGPPRTSICALFLGKPYLLERTQAGTHIIVSGDAWVKKRFPNGPFWAIRSLVYCFSFPSYLRHGRTSYFVTGHLHQAGSGRQVPACVQSADLSAPLSQRYSCECECEF